MSKFVDKMDVDIVLGKGKYSGNVDENEKPHGSGIVYFGNGDYFSGEFEHGKIDTGKYMYRNGSYYYMVQKYSIYPKEDSFTYFNCGYNGMIQKSNGQPDYFSYEAYDEVYGEWHYVGEMKNNLPDGCGKFYKDDVLYVGGWKDGVQHGVGAYCFKSGIIEWCLFDNGKKVKVLNEVKIKKSSTIKVSDGITIETKHGGTFKMGSINITINHNKTPSSRYSSGSSSSSSSSSGYSGSSYSSEDDDYTPRYDDDDYSSDDDDNDYDSADEYKQKTMDDILDSLHYGSDDALGKINSLRYSGVNTSDCLFTDGINEYSLDDMAKTLEEEQEEQEEEYDSSDDEYEY